MKKLKSLMYFSYLHEKSICPIALFSDFERLTSGNVKICNALFVCFYLASYNKQNKILRVFSWPGICIFTEVSALGNTTTNPSME